MTPSDAKQGRAEFKYPAAIEKASEQIGIGTRKHLERTYLGQPPS